MSERKFDLSEKQQLLVLNTLRSCFTKANYVVPVFISDLTLQLLKDNVAKDDLKVEYEKYLGDNCNTIVDWYVGRFSLFTRVTLRIYYMVEQIRSNKEPVLPDFYDSTENNHVC
jgi:hypothetical protein